MLFFISSLRNDDVSATKLKTKELGELFLKFIKEELDNDALANQELINKINGILNWKGRNLKDLGMLYSRLEEEYSDYYFQDNKDVEVIYLALRNAAYNFLNYITWRLLVFER